MLAQLRAIASEDTEIELILNGDIFDLLKVKVNGSWPTKSRRKSPPKSYGCAWKAIQVRTRVAQIPVWAAAPAGVPARQPRPRYVVPAPQELFKRYVAPGELSERVRFITSGDTYYLPRASDPPRPTSSSASTASTTRGCCARRATASRVLDLPYGSLWILEVLNPAKELRNNVRPDPAAAAVHPRLVLLRSGFRVAVPAQRHLAPAAPPDLHAARLDRALPPPTGDPARRGVRDRRYDHAATRYLQRLRGVHTMIVGHSHAPRFRVLPNSKLLVNTARG